MATQALPAPDTDQRNLDLLKDSNGNWLHSVTIGVAAEFLQVSPQRIRTLVFKGRLASEGFRQTRRILVSSLSVFEPDTHEKRSARAKVTIGKVSQAERLARGKKAGRTRMERFTPEQRSAFPKARMDKSTHEERSTLAAARFAKSTPEHLSAFRGTADERHARAKKANATLTSEQLSARAKKGAPARQAKLTSAQRFRLKEERAKLTFEEQSAIATKAANTRKAKYTPEQRSAWGKKAAAAVSPEKRSDNARRLREFHAQVKADREELRRLKALENGPVAHKKSKGMGRPKDEKAAAYYAAVVEAGNPTDTETLVKIAKRFYPKRIDRSIGALRKKIAREKKKSFSVDKSKNTTLTGPLVNH